ncbi:MAG: Bug family tripartite tricarboxylate transporter substrate binding protein [Pseudorhodoplanes sp.]|uniref:Bug family tripartite tricarboxylate transporter substrate binding protein n=1 Tax=Pseudorhodoplanes sp. TaxID=1934341 RepID=UPI003D0F6114
MLWLRTRTNPLAGMFRRWMAPALLVGTVILATGLTAPAVAEGLPSPIRLLIPFAPGGVVDLAARLLAEEIQKKEGISIIIENKPGANGALAARAVKAAEPDGKTLLFTSSSVITINPVLSKDAGYDPVTDFTPVAIAAYSDMILVAGPKMKATTLKEFIAEAKASNSPLTIGSAGQGNTTHGYLELFRKAAGVDITHVPYKGGAPAITDVLGGNIAGAVVALNVAVSHIKAGTMRGLAVVGDKRSAAVPDVPTFKESGFEGLTILTWLGLMAPKGTPDAIVQSLSKAVAHALTTESVKSKFAANGIVPYSLGGADFAKAIGEEGSAWKKAF